MNKENLEALEKELSGENNVFWKVINKHLTPETQSFIRHFIVDTIEKQLSLARVTWEKEKKYQFNQEYGFDELADLERDIIESFDKRYNPDAAEPITDKYGVFNGVYRVTVEYIEDENK